MKQYRYKIIPYLGDLINDHKAIKNESNEWKVQINMHVTLISSKDTGEIPTIYIWNEKEEIRSGNETDDIIKGLLSSFLNNYQQEETVLREGSGFVFESVELSYIFHKKKKKSKKKKIIHKISLMGIT